MGDAFCIPDNQQGKNGKTFIELLAKVEDNRRRRSSSSSSKSSSRSQSKNREAKIKKNNNYQPKAEAGKFLY